MGEKIGGEIEDLIKKEFEPDLIMLFG